MAINRRGDRYVVDWWTEGRRYRKFFDRQHDARDFAAKVRNDKRLGTHVAADKIPLFHEAARDWLTSRGDRGEGSFATYRAHVERHLIPAFGDRRLDQITPEMITTWRTALRQTGGTSRWHRPMAPRTAAALMQRLSAIFNTAVSTGRLVSNPVKKLERPYTRRRRGKRDNNAVRANEILSPAEIRKLLAAARPGFEKALFTLAAASGMRSGELLGLRWADVSFEGNRVSVRQSLGYNRGPLDAKPMAHFGPPKTEAGERDITIDAAVTRLLKEWKLQAGRNSFDLVFASPDGTPMRRPVMLKSHFWPTLKRAGLRHVRFHSLRHSFATALIERRAPVTEVAKLLGHEDPSITLRVYSHWFTDADSGAAAAYTADLLVDTK